MNQWAAIVVLLDMLSRVDPNQLTPNQRVQAMDIVHGIVAIVLRDASPERQAQVTSRLCSRLV